MPCLAPNQQVSVLLVDDDARFRCGLQTLLEFYNTKQNIKFNVIGEATSSEQAVQIAAEQQPELILLDLELAIGDGIAALTSLTTLDHKPKILVVSGHREDEWVFRAMRAGANGYVIKDELANHLCAAIDTVMNNQVYLSLEVATSFFQMFRFYTGQANQAKIKLHLTNREQQVLHWLVQGASNEEIASRMCISIATVKAHLSAIFQKLDVTSRTQAIIRALKLGLVS